MSNELQQWEYETASIYGTTSAWITDKDFVKICNRMGLGGWQFCGMYNNTAIFKRPKINPK